jgi:hypothetical protein
MEWVCCSDGNHNDCIENFDGEIAHNTVTLNTRKDLGG